MSKVKVLRLSDRIKLKLGNVKFYLAPLSNDRKIEISSCTSIVGGESVFDHTKGQHLYIKYSLKKIEGLTNYDNTDYELDFEGDALTDDCVSEIFNIPQKEDLVTCAWQILNGIPDKLIDSNGKPLKGAALEVVKREKKAG